MVRRSSSVYRWILTTIVVLATVPSLASGQSSLSTSEICPDELAACLGNADCVECQESINLLGQCGVDVTTSVYDSTKISDLVSATTSLAVSTEISEVACDDVSDLYCCVSTYTDCLANDVAAEYLGCLYSTFFPDCQDLDCSTSGNGAAGVVTAPTVTGCLATASFIGALTAISVGL